MRYDALFERSHDAVKKKCINVRNFALKYAA